MLSALYTIIIYPLYQIIELSYRIFFEICENEGIAVIGVSVAVTLLCFPLYAVAESWQQVERDTQKRLRPGIDRIKATFRGDEQYMILNAFYKENHYHPMYALRSSFGLLIQIPFFMAAYSFLSHNGDLLGRSFLFIKDMGKPDAFLSIGGFPINILPVAMTLINVFAGAIYTKGFAVKEKIQIYGMALIFLIILYNSPSGLVLYWTMNNVFSLIKNIFYKLKNPLKVFWILMTACLSLASIAAFPKMGAFHSFPIVLVALLTGFFPLIMRFINFMLDTCFSELLESPQKRNLLFFVSTASLFLLTGIVIPTMLMASSTASDFAYIDGYTTPLYFIYNCALQSFGLFFVWTAAIYFLFGKRVKAFLSVLFFTGLVLALVNAFVFPGNYGIISADLIFIEYRSFKPSAALFCVSSATTLAVLLAVVLLFKKRLSKAVSSMNAIFLISLVAVGFLNGAKVQHAFLTTAKPEASLSDIQPVIKLSKTNKNVLVFMLDRAPGFYVQDIFAQNPDIADDYTGFTFYPNTISLGSWTIQGAPGLYGGYEYGPWEMNQKRELPMQEKHNQAISLLSVMFEREGFESYVIDPPYPNYDSEPVFEIFEGHEHIHPKICTGKYTDIWYRQNGMEKLPVKSRRIKRNLIWFSLFRISPPIFRSAIHYEDWWSSPKEKKSMIDFIDRYSVLDYLPLLTETDSDAPCFVYWDNETTHDSAFVEPPDFRPIEGEVDKSLILNKEFINSACYFSHNASLRRIAEFIRYLKENGVYDNTRIIISSDHGLNERTSKITRTGNIEKNIEWFNPSLLVKDFGDDWKGLKINDTLMSNADVPALAIEGLLQDDKNPYTGNEIKILSPEEKQEKLIVSFSKANAVRSNRNNGFIIQDTDWYTVRDSIFTTANWTRLKVKDDKILE